MNFIAIGRGNLRSLGLSENSERDLQAFAEMLMSAEVDAVFGERSHCWYRGRNTRPKPSIWLPEAAARLILD